MHHGDAHRGGVSRAGETGGLVLPEERAAVGLIDAGDDLHKRRFACAVFAHQEMDLAGLYVEIAGAKGGDAAEALFNLLKLEQHPKLISVQEEGAVRRAGGRFDGEDPHLRVFA